MLLSFSLYLYTLDSAQPCALDVDAKCMANAQKTSTTLAIINFFYLPKLRFNIDLRLHYIEITFRGKLFCFPDNNNSSSCISRICFLVRNIGELYGVWKVYNANKRGNIVVCRTIRCDDDCRSL